MSTDFLTLAKHSFVYFLANIIPAIISFITLILYTRLLDPVSYGVYCLIYSAAILGLSVVFGSLGLSTARFWPGIEAEDDRVRFLSTCYYYVLLLLLVVSLLAVIVLMFVYFKFANAVIFWGVAIFITQSIVQINLDYLRAEFKPHYYSTMNCMRACLALLFGVGLFIFGYGLSGILAGIVIANLVTLLLFSKPNNRWSHKRISAIDFTVLKKILLYSAPLTVNFAINYIIGNSDRWLIVWLLSIKQAGLYAAAYNLPLYCLSVIMGVINMAVFPFVVKIYEKHGAVAAREQLSKQFVLFFSLILPACAGFLLLNHNIINLALGAQFRDTAMLLVPWVVVATFLSGIKTFYFDVSFHISKRTLSLLWISIIIAISNVGLNLWLIPQLGILGSAVASTIAFAIGLVLSIVWGRRYFRIPFPHKLLWRILVPLLVMILVLELIRNWHGNFILFIQIALGILAYGIAFAGVNWKISYELFNRAILNKVIK
jgi:O-antigen/teichoic acid export membrane protein